MSGAQIFNAIEAGWWGVVALVVYFVPFPSRTGWSRWPLIALLLLFGVSDIVEVWTGAWWRPWWLGVWKGGCVAGISVLGIFVARALRGDRKP